MKNLKISNRRWVIVFTLFLAVVCNYIDRQLLSILKPEILEHFSIGNFEYAWIVNVFLICYAIMYPISGILVDKLGPKKVLTVGIFVWSLACIGGGCCASNQVILFTACRAFLGLSEPTIFAAQIIAVAMWFEKKDRGFPHAMCNIGGAIGAVLAPVVIAGLMKVLDAWQHVFWLAGVCGLVIGLIWIVVFKEPPKEVLALTAEEESAKEGELKTYKFTRLLKTKSLWAGVFIRLISDPVWYFCCFWLPSFLRMMGDAEGLSNDATLSMIQWIGGIPFLAGAIGSLALSKLSDSLIRKGGDSTKSRKKALYIAAAFGPVIMLTPLVIESSLNFEMRIGLVIAIFCIVAALANAWLHLGPLTIIEQFPLKNASSILGIFCGAGALGSIFFNQYIGTVNEEGMTAVFIIMGFLHIIAAIIMWKFVSKENLD